MDTDADRLALLEGLGGVRVQLAAGEMTAVFDRQYLGDSVGGLDIESRSPALTCRTSDVAALKVSKGQSVTVDGSVYRVRRHEPDGTGISVVVLES